MATFPSRLFVIVVILLGQPVFAQEEVSKEAPLPQRDTPVPKIEGYADWKFTDSLETLQSDNRLTFIEAGEEKCAFGKEENRDQSRWPDCFYYQTQIFQEPAEIFILVGKEHIDRILIHFNRRDSKSDSKDCASVIHGERLCAARQGQSRHTAHGKEPPWQWSQRCLRTVGIQPQASL